MPPADRPGDTDGLPDLVLDLTDPEAAVEAIERVIDLRVPGAPYTYPSSPAGGTGCDARHHRTRHGADERAGDPDEAARAETGMFGVARGSTDVPTAPPEFS